ncbi:hypothetical protein DPMN_180854 [Dreissena polymorpha]|uniref:Uncharacterized protein n=1 Tax=Dreissena polymorpha TaxID=45954 RepID=A0A9D4DCK0_DREPO|nr:hypothetical protein DPMN_180854 [Dreissena polymorpha]
MSLEQMKNAPPPDIIGTNLLTKFHHCVNTFFGTLSSENHLVDGHTDGHTYGRTDRQSGHVWLRLKFHDDRTINVASRKMPSPLGSHVFPPTGTIFKVIEDMIGTNSLTKFHDDRTINVASRVLIRKNAPPPHDIIGTNPLTMENAPPPGCHLVQDIIRMNHLTKFHEDRTINVAPRVLTRFYYSHIYI